MSGGVGGRNVTELGKRGSGPASSNCCSSVTTLRPAPFDRNGGKQWEVGPRGGLTRFYCTRGGVGGETSVLPLILLSRPSMQARSSAGLGSQDHKLYLHLSELHSYI